MCWITWLRPIPPSVSQFCCAVPNKSIVSIAHCSRRVGSTTAQPSCSIAYCRRHAPDTLILCHATNHLDDRARRFFGPLRSPAAEQSGVSGVDVETLQNARDRVARQPAAEQNAPARASVLPRHSVSGRPPVMTEALAGQTGCRHHPTTGAPAPVPRIGTRTLTA